MSILKKKSKQTTSGRQRAGYSLWSMLSNQYLCAVFRISIPHSPLERLLGRGYQHPRGNRLLKGKVVWLNHCKELTLFGPNLNGLNSFPRRALVCNAQSTPRKAVELGHLLLITTTYFRLVMLVLEWKTFFMRNLNMLPWYWFRGVPV